MRNLLFRKFLAGRLLLAHFWIRGYHLEGMLRHHHRIARHAIHHHRVVGRHLRVILQIVQSTIEILADTRIRSQDIALTIEFEGDAIGVLVIAETGIDGSHQVVLLVHTASHRYPRHVRGIEHRTRICLNL